jgi:hypothetical protein
MELGFPFEKPLENKKQIFTDFVLKWHVTCPFIPNMAKMIFDAGDKGMRDFLWRKSESRLEAGGKFSPISYSESM